MAPSILKDLILQDPEVEYNQQLRHDLEYRINSLQARRYSAERFAVIQKLQEALMWMGQDNLKRLEPSQCDGSKISETTQGDPTPTTKPSSVWPPPPFAK